MSKFNGAVLVDNEKIEQALCWYKLYFNANNKRARELKAKAKLHVAGYGKFKKWYYSSSKREDKELSVFIGKYLNMFDWLCDGYFRAGLICEAEYKILMTHNYDRDELYGDIKAMISCGKPVYLNPTQARFVNSWTFDK
tara:strand:+ start:760 stop:1176 length:417 start_codon:yes stop_codon:yes gene_type:complete